MNYIEDLADFDEASQKILLSTRSVRAQVVVPAVQRQSPYHEVKTTGGIMRGETVRGMGNVSPLVSYKLSGQSSGQIFQKYFPAAGVPIEKGNSILILDPVPPEEGVGQVQKNGYDFIVYDFYLDKDNDNRMNIDTEFMFKLLLFVSTDGNKVRECYEVCQPADDEILLFLETDRDTFSDRVLYGRVSEKIRKTYVNTRSGESYPASGSGNLLDIALEGELLDYVRQHFEGVTAETVEELLTKGFIEKTGIRGGFFTALKYTLLTVSAPGKALGWVLEKMGTGIELLKISEKFWDTEHSEYYFRKETLIENLSISAEQVGALSQLFLDRQGSVFSDLTPQLLDVLILGQLSAVGTFVDSYNNFIREYIGELVEEGQDVGGQRKTAEITELVALLCGIWDGLVDFVASSFRFMGAMLQAPRDIAGDFQAAFETLDNILSLLKDPNLWNSLLNAGLDGALKLLEYLNGEEGFNWVRIHYIIGYAGAFVGTLFIPELSLAKVAEVVKMAEGTFLGKIKPGLMEAVSGVLLLKKGSGKGTFLKTGQAIQELLELFVRGGQKLREFMDELCRKLAEWVLKEKTLFQKRGFFKDIAGYTALRKKFHEEKLVENFWKTKVNSKLLYQSNLKKLVYKYFDSYPKLLGHNISEYKTMIKKKGKLIETAEELSISGEKDIIIERFGNPPKLPGNLIDVFGDWEDYMKFVEGVVDFKGQRRRYDSEVKYIFNFLRHHIDKGDEFVIEIRNIFKTCNSCKREFAMLEAYLKSKGKKVKITVFSDESIDGTFELKRALKIKKTLWK